MRVLIGKVFRLLDVKSVRHDPGTVATVLRELFGKFLIHLALEDRLLYPKLHGCPEAHLRLVADGFEREMCVIKENFDTYRRAWPSPLAISRDSARFVLETKEVLGALKRRISSDDLDLYPCFENTVVSPMHDVRVLSAEHGAKTAPSDEQFGGRASIGNQTRPHYSVLSAKIWSFPWADHRLRSPGAMDRSLLGHDPSHTVHPYSGANRPRVGAWRNNARRRMQGGRGLGFRRFCRFDRRQSLALSACRRQRLCFHRFRHS